jgi:error-prone DNA polymerase
MADTKLWFFPRALGRGYPLAVVEKIWKVLEAFASFGFCKAHAAAFACSPTTRGCTPSA